MEQRGVPPEVITIIQQLHRRAQYVYQAGPYRGSTVTTNGIKQGCVIAPYLWNYFSLAFLLILQDKRSLTWIQATLSLFADDVWGSWIIQQATDLTQAVEDLSLILETLETLEMTVNYSKTAILLRLAGRDATQLKRQHTFMKAGQLHLRVWVHGRECSIPVKEQREYLGTVVTYKHRHQRNMQHRLRACTAKYQGLRKLLNGSHHLSEGHRLRLWKACVGTSAFYAQHIVGVTSQSLQTLTAALTKHLRAILRIPAHLTHISTGDVWRRAQLPMPGWTLQHSQQQVLAKLTARAQCEPDITTSPCAVTHLQQQASRLEAILLDVATGLAKTPTQTPAVNCPFCPEVFITENAMRVHCGIKHKSVPQHSTKTPTAFKPELHSKAGMPACQLCDRQFWRWAHLISHIESGACRCLGGESAVRAPIPDDQPLADIRQPPTAGLGIFGEENTVNMPLIQRTAFLNSLDKWEQWLHIPAVRLELAQHCVICHFWVADFRHMKQHLNRAHLQDHPQLMQQALTLCYSFKTHLRRDSSCIWCSHKVGAPGRHVVQCTPLVQLCLAVVYCRNAQHLPGVRIQRRGRDICQLLARPAGLPRAGEQVSEEAPPGGSALVGAPPAATPRQEPSPFWGTPGKLPEGPTAASLPSGSCPSPHPSGSTAGADDQSTEARQGLRPFHASGGRRDTGGTHASGSRMERKEKPGRASPPLSSQDRAPVKHGEGALESGPASRRHRGQQSSHGQSRMAQYFRRVDLPDLESHREAPHCGQEPIPSPTHGSRQDSELPVGEPYRGSHPALRLNGAASQAGAAGSSDGDLRPRSVPSGTNSCGTLPQLRASVRLLSHESDRSLDEERHPATITDGKASGRPLLSEVAPASASSATNINATSPPAHPIPPSGLLASDVCPAASARALVLPSIRLQGGSNSCYLNSFLYCLWLGAHHSDMRHCVPQVLWEQSGQPRTATRLMGLRLLGWPRPQQQHDTAELIDFLQPRVVLSLVPGRWEARRLAADGSGVHVTASTTALKCLLLAQDSAHPTPSVQDLISQWHHQLDMYAFSDVPPWCFLQLPRFQYHARGWPVKQSQAYILPSTLQLPRFTHTDDVSISWVLYRVVAHVQHHGPAPTSGHYTVAVSDLHHRYWLLDDEKEPQRMSDQQVDHLSRNVYLMLLVRDSEATSAQGSHSPVASSCTLHHHDILATAGDQALGGPRLDLQSTVSDSGTDCHAGREHGVSSAHSNPGAATDSYLGDSPKGTGQARARVPQQVPDAITVSSCDSMGKHG